VLQSCGVLHVRVPATATVLPNNLDIIDDAQMRVEMIEISAMKLKLLSFFAFCSWIGNSAQGAVLRLACLTVLPTRLRNS
jgi:hypothetical protein